MKRSVTELLDPEIVAEADDAFPNVVTLNMKLTDLGNAERLVARYRDRIRYCPPRKTWLAWDGKRWRWDDTGAVNRLAKRTIRSGYAEAEHAKSEDGAKAIAKHFAKSEDASRIAAMLKLASTEEGIPVLPDMLDANPWLLNVANGTVDLRTGELGPHRKSDLMTKIVDINYDPTAKHEIWEQFLDVATGNDAELRGFLQRMAGYCATGLTSEKHFFFIYSKKSNTGKSTFADAVRMALGDYARDADFDTWLEQSGVGGNRGDLAMLAGSRLAISVEVRKRAKFDTKLMKKITGGDPVVCAAKYEKEFSFKPGFKILMAANAAPAIHDDDRPLFERCLRVPFDAQVPEGKKDPEVKRRLSDPEDAGPAVLAWVVQGALVWQQNGLGVPHAVKRSSQDYRSEMDRFGGFVAERCVIERAAWVRKGELKKDYLEWCQENDIKYPLAAKDIVERFDEMGIRGARFGHRGHHWQGVRLRTPEDPDPGGTSGDVRDPNSQNFSTRDVEEKSYGNRDTLGPSGPPDSSDTEDVEREAIQNEGPSPDEDAPGFEWMSPEGE